MTSIDFFFTSLRDRFLAAIGILILGPVLIVLWIKVKAEDRGPGFFFQERVGKKGKIFYLIKLRTMFVAREQSLLVTTGTSDLRITKIGKFLRKYKLDELPQLFNVLKGDMLLVGPRPEVPSYVQHYPKEFINILDYPPGITDINSLNFAWEEKILEESLTPHETYIQVVLPQKLKKSYHYLLKRNFFTDFYILYLTVIKILKPEK